LLNVSGPGGVGKSALLGAFRRLAEEAGRPVVVAEGRGMPPTPECLLARLGGASLKEVAQRLNHAQPLVLLDTFEELADLSRSCFHCPGCRSVSYNS
jgi:putative ribosome biogenesis GTPase RsgA